VSFNTRGGRGGCGDAFPLHDEGKPHSWNSHAISRSRFMMLVALILVFNIYTSYAWRRPLLLHGRPEHGMLKTPSCESCDEPEDEPVNEQWFTQHLDHYDPQNSKTWQQRYFVNESYWTNKEKGPVFLMLGGEGPASPDWLNENTDMMRNAKKYGALTFIIEHRLWGIYCRHAK